MIGVQIQSQLRNISRVYPNVKGEYEWYVAFDGLTTIGIETVQIIRGLMRNKPFFISQWQ